MVASWQRRGDWRRSCDESVKTGQAFKAKERLYCPVGDEKQEYFLVFFGTPF